MQEVSKIWFDGRLVDWKDANVHVLTHALHYGSGVFEGIRCYNTVKGPAVFRLREHLERLFESAKMYHMSIPYSVDDLIKAVKEVIKINGLKECYIRPIVFRGYKEMGLNPMPCPVRVVIAVWPWGAYLGDAAIKGVRAKVSSFSRITPNSLPSQAKATGQYINSILATLDAKNAGCDEAIMLDYRGFVSEGPGENLFLVKDGVLLTPPSHASILKGLTRDAVINLAKKKGLEVVEKDITKAELYTADELFMTGTAAEVAPIRSVDGYDVPCPGSITKKLRDAFFEVVKGNNKEFEKWLDYVN